MKTVILGGGESGAGAAVLAKANGLSVFVSDMGAVKEKYKQLLNTHEIEWEEGSHSEDKILSADLIIKSPGISDEALIIQKAKKKQIKIISEIEFAHTYCKAKIIGITGSNGKTTTTLLCYHILKKAGLNVGLAGNVGKSFALQLAENSYDYYVLELSSFQLDGTEKFKPWISVILNITPDHLDRYDNSLEKYIQSKFRITENQDENDHFIYCADDKNILREMKGKEIKAQKYPFSLTHENYDQGAWVKDEQLIIRTKKKQFEMSTYDLAMQGKHNLYNSMAAGISSRILDLRKDLIRESLSDFQNIEHRLEFVSSIHGIEFINDSKATNVNSTWYALESMNKPVIWIVGGVDKGNDYAELIDLVKDKVKAIVCLGKDNEKIKAAFKDIIPNIHEVGSAHESVVTAYTLGQKGDVVLLSPACASFDLFENYEDRGQQFKKAVKSL